MSPAATAILRRSPEVAMLSTREHFRDRYWLERDPINEDRLLWRAQTFRHMVHLLPGQTVLELGAGRGRFTRHLAAVTRGRNPITAVGFDPAGDTGLDSLPGVEGLVVESLPGALAGRRFDFIVAMDLLDRRNCAWLLRQVYELLEPGGQVLFYESNPWNPVLQLRRFLSRLLRRPDPRRLLGRGALYELLSAVGFVRIFAVFNDFVYPPLPRWLIWPLRNLSILLENLPGVRAFAGSILLHAQKPPLSLERSLPSLFEHPALRGAVSVVVPCRNEEMNVGPLIGRLDALFGEYLHEIIPVDDGSEDGTAEVIRDLARADPRIRPVFRDPPNGVGRAIKDGFRAATGQWVLSMDCDFQHLLPEMRDLFDAAAEGWDVVIGSRFSRHSVLLNYPFQKIIANRGFHVLALLLLRRRFRDVTNNLKLMRREVVDGLDLQQPGFAVNAETGLLPLLMGRTVKEVPISWINREPDMGVSSFRLIRVGGGYWQVLLQLTWRTRFGTRPLRPLPAATSDS
ncbi:MAG: glycosyltransferase [Gemmatimonadota bacterium]